MKWLLIPFPVRYQYIDIYDFDYEDKQIIALQEERFYIPAQCHCREKQMIFIFLQNSSPHKSLHTLMLGSQQSAALCYQSAG